MQGLEFRPRNSWKAAIVRRTDRHGHANEIQGHSIFVDFLYSTVYPTAKASVEAFTILATMASVTYTHIHIHMLYMYGYITYQYIAVLCICIYIHT